MHAALLEFSQSLLVCLCAVLYQQRNCKHALWTILQQIATSFARCRKMMACWMALLERSPSLRQRRTLMTRIMTAACTHLSARRSSWSRPGLPAMACASEHCMGCMQSVLLCRRIQRGCTKVSRCKPSPERHCLDTHACSREEAEEDAAAEARHMAVQSLDTNIDEPARVLLPSGQVAAHLPVCMRLSVSRPPGAAQRLVAVVHTDALHQAQATASAGAASCSAQPTMHVCGAGD